MPTSPPQVRLPTSGPTLKCRNIHGSMSPPEPAPSSISITFGPKTAALGRPPVGPVPRGPAAHRFLSQEIDVVVGDLPAAVEPLVDDERILVDLREEVALEVGQALEGGVRHVDVADLAVRRLLDLAEVALNPLHVSQGVFALERLDRDRPAVLAISVRADGDFDRLAGRVLEERVQLGRRLEVNAADREQVLTLP